ncbi:OCIA domain-containing protein 1 [Euwallacea similis]|uniref:OCIA domain-containing protein 1 n=1 Tax=Euwallacea similis TaxID=1736056 RepID=UPI00344F4C60
MINSGEEPERKTPFPGPNAQRRPQIYKFTQDELRVLKECNKESFYTRSLPFSFVLGGLTYYGLQIGYLTKNPRFGVYPKIGVAVTVGYFLGKYSYLQKCAEKFMALPDSKVGRALKAQRLGIPEQEEDQIESPFSISPFGGVSDSYTDIPSARKNYDYDSRPVPEGLDDSFRPSLDNPIILHQEEMPPEQKHVSTYDELRLKNREEYDQKRIQAYRQSRIPSSQVGASPPPQEFNDDYKPAQSGSKTKYGDVWG